jgi:DNA-binding NarL/FixJ family response regulator
MVDEVGVEGYVHKADGLDELATALSAVAGGASYYSRHVTAMQMTVRNLGLDCEQLKTLQLYALNLTGEQVAAKQHCSDRTLRRRMQHVKQVLHLPSGMKNTLVGLAARKRGLVV